MESVAGAQTQLLDSGEGNAVDRRPNAIPFPLRAGRIQDDEDYVEDVSLQGSIDGQDFRGIVGSDARL